MAATVNPAEQKLNALAAITLTLTADEVLAPWRNMLSNAHCDSAWSRAWADCPPTKTSGAITGRYPDITQEQTQRNAALNEMRQRYKKKRNNLPMSKPFASRKRVLNAGSPARAVTGGSALPTLWFTSHPAVEAYQALEPGVNQARY